MRIKIPTAEEYIKFCEKNNPSNTIQPENLINFAHMHVKAAIRELLDIRKHPQAFPNNGTWWIPKDSLQKSYTKNKIK